ncbi:hypothetical protein BGX26_010544 [Mortierella sp. AD094]|nr:hypothetical protein BGX26_010544 [Mortierella sp. AD094]
MEEGPRTAFRHESFMALVKDAAKGFYAPPLDTDPHAAAPSHPGPSTFVGPPSTFVGPTTYAAAGGAYTTVGNGDDHNSPQGSRYSAGSDRSLQYLDIGPANARPYVPPPHNG